MAPSIQLFGMSYARLQTRPHSFGHSTFLPVIGQSGGASLGFPEVPTLTLSNREGGPKDSRVERPLEIMCSCRVRAEAGRMTETEL